MKKLDARGCNLIGLRPHVPGKSFVKGRIDFLFGATLADGVYRLQKVRARVHDFAAYF